VRTGVTYGDLVIDDPSDSVADGERVQIQAPPARAQHAQR